MGFELSLSGDGWDHALIQKKAVSEVMKYNDLTLKYGLVLTEQQAVALVETCSLSLKETGMYTVKGSNDTTLKQQGGGSFADDRQLAGRGDGRTYLPAGKCVES